MEPIATGVEYTLISDVRRAGASDRTYRHAAKLGRLVRIHRGAYVDPKAWERLGPEEQYLLRAKAAAEASRSRPVLSHETAAILWGIPRIRPVPAKIHVLTSMAAGSRPEGPFQRHATGRFDVGIVDRGTYRLTGSSRTLIDCGAVVPFADAVVAFDWALHGTDEPTVLRGVLEALTRHLHPVRAQSRVLRALHFADAAAESPGESLSRVVLHQLGFPEPVLQQRFDDARGPIGRVDFWWPEFRIIGEFDGASKYLEQRYTGGAKPARVLMEEKRRENRIRALGPGVVRWDWRTATQPAELRALLIEAGLPIRRASSATTG
jgi:predicted transcriptional regulator of viral defense system